MKISNRRLNCLSLLNLVLQVKTVVVPTEKTLDSELLAPLIATLPLEVTFALEFPESLILRIAKPALE